MEIIEKMPLTIKVMIIFQGTSASTLNVSETLA